MPDRIDKRIVRTRQLIRDSFCRLLEKKPSSQISVTELCNLSGINRNTFYCHYQNTREVLEEMEQEVMSQINDALGDVHNSVEAITLTCRILKDNQKICRVLMTGNAESGLFSSVLDLSSIRGLNVMKKENNPLLQKYQVMLSDFLVAGSNALIQAWVRSGMKESPEDIAELITEICYHGASNLSSHPPGKFQA